MREKLNLEQIRSEARFYCYGAANSINIQRAKDPLLQNQLNQTIENSKSMSEVLIMSFEQVASFTAKYVKDKINSSGLDAHDLDNVGWEMGLICYVWSNSLPTCKGNFTGIFTTTWNKYFSDQDIIESKRIFLKDSYIKSIIQSPGFGFKLENDERDKYDYDFSSLLDQMKYDTEHPLRLFWVFTSAHNLTNFSNQNTSSIQSWYLTKNNLTEKDFFSKKKYAVFAPEYAIDELKEEPTICIQLEVLKKFMVGMQREFPSQFSNSRLKRVIGLNY
jgi:hypothetical protein